MVSAVLAISKDLTLLWPSASVFSALIATGLLRPWLQRSIEQRLLVELCTPLEPDSAMLAGLRAALMTAEEPSSQAWDTWCTTRELQPDCLDPLACEQQLNQLKRRWFGDAARAEFLRLGAQLDQVSFSLLQTNDPELAQEWFFKLQDRDCTFSALAPKSLGSEKMTGGRLGPLRLRNLQPPLNALLARAPLGAVQPPVLTPSGRTIIVRLDARSPAQWDGDVDVHLVEQQYEAWLTTVINGWLQIQPAPGTPLLIPQP